MEGGTALLPRKRRHVALAENLGELAEGDNAVVIGNCVSDSAIVKSGLLSGIESTEGLACLPGHLAPTDVRIWETAHFVDADISPKDLVTVLKVADALSDTNIMKWVTKLGSAVLETDWAHSERAADAMLCCLLCLPPHLLHSVMSAYLAVEALSVALTRFPAALHAPVMAAAAASGHVAISHGIAVRALVMLPQITAISPGLLSLGIYTADKAEHHPPFASRHSTGAIVARAASAHPSLTYLRLAATPLPPQWLRTFSDCLGPGALPSLVSLTLSADAHPGGCAEVAACLRLLPSLTSLMVSFELPSQSPNAVLPLSTYARLGGTPATLPHLQSLTYSDECPETRASGGLIHRAALTTQASCASWFLSLLCAPALKRIDLSPQVPLHMAAFQTQLARFTALEDVTVYATAQPLRQPLPALPADSLQLPGLQKLTVGGYCLVSPVAIAAHIAALASMSLTLLRLSREAFCAAERVPYRSQREEELTDAAEAQLVTISSCRFFNILGRCTGLKHVTLDCLCGLSAEQRLCGDALATSIGRLTQLTHLQLRPAEETHVTLDGRTMSTAIRALSSIRWLSLDSHCGSLTMTPFEMVLDACAELKQVTHLELPCVGVTAAHVVGLLPRMPCLRHLELLEDIFDENVDELEAVQEVFRDVNIELR